MEVFEKILDFINKYWIVILVIMIIGIPLIIHSMFYFVASSPYFVARWSAGDFLTYISSIIVGSATVFLGAIVILQNKSFRLEEIRRIKAEKQARLAAFKPRIKVQCVSSYHQAGQHSPFQHQIGCELFNESHNTAINFHIENIIVIYKDNSSSKIDSQMQIEKFEYGENGIVFDDYCIFREPSMISFDCIYFDLQNNAYKIQVKGNSSKQKLTTWEIISTEEKLISDVI